MATIKGPLLPFKGKGELHQKITCLSAECEELRQRMQNLCTGFKTIFHKPAPAHLSVRNIRGCLYLEWRARGNHGRGQSFLDLCSSEQGQQILSELSDPMRQVYLDYERKRLELSLAYRLCFHELRMLRDHLSGLRNLASQGEQYK